MSDRRLETIRALLAQAEATTFPEEAKSFSAKAEALMARYAIDEAMLADHRGDGSTPTEVVITVHRPYPAQKALLVCEVARCFGCVGVRHLAPSGSSTEEVHVVGFSSDLTMVDTLVTSLLVQLSGAMLRGQPSSRTPSASAAWRRSFIGGFIETVVGRLEAQRAAVVVDVTDSSPSGASVALVLADRESRVDDDVRRRYPRLRTSRISHGSSHHGRRSGRDAGTAADLGGGRLGAPRSLTA
jgi:hypothetical protein